MSVTVKVKVKAKIHTEVQAMKVQRWSRGIALLDGVCGWSVLHSGCFSSEKETR
jgi:hypothetical protein